MYCVTGLGSPTGEIDIGSQKIFDLFLGFPHVQEFMDQVKKFDNYDVNKISKKILASRKSKGL
jgi:hypothetical protein